MSSPQRTRWEEHYASGHTPWDTQITPPEVQSFWASGRLAPSGLALDIGCGPGTNVLYLARLGLLAVGFDIAGGALATGRERILAGGAHIEHRTAFVQATFVQADVAALPLAGCAASYILDLGCSHGLPAAAREALALAVVANLRPGGYYHLYAFDRVAQVAGDQEGAASSQMGMDENEVAERFTPHLHIVEIVRARPDRHPCRWYLLRKPA